MMYVYASIKQSVEQVSARVWRESDKKSLRDETFYHHILIIIIKKGLHININTHREESKVYERERQTDEDEREREEREERESREEEGEKGNDK